MIYVLGVYLAGGLFAFGFVTVWDLQELHNEKPWSEVTVGDVAALMVVAVLVTAFWPLVLLGEAFQKVKDQLVLRRAVKQLGAVYGCPLSEAEWHDICKGLK